MIWRISKGYVELNKVHATQGVITTNIDMEILTVNNNLLYLLGYDENEMRGSPITMFLSSVLPLEFGQSVVFFIIIR